MFARELGVASMWRRVAYLPRRDPQREHRTKTNVLHLLAKFGKMQRLKLIAALDMRSSPHNNILFPARVSLGANWGHECD